jgi:integrase
MPKFPLSVRRGSAAVSIRPYQNNGSGHFLITWNVLGKRHRESRSTLDAAKLRAEELAIAISNGKIEATELSGADRDSYHHALHLLEPLGIPLHAAVEEFVAARNILGTGSLIDAAQAHSMRNVTKLRTGTVPELVEKCIVQKEQDGLSRRYLIQLRSDLRRLAAAFPCPVASLGTSALDEWLRDLKIAPRTRNNFRTSFTTFFSFCRRNGYLSKNVPTEAEGISKAKVRSGDIAILRPTQMQALLNDASSEMIPFITLGGFAGLRSAEIQRLEWADILFDQGWIEVKPEHAKTGSRRLVPISDNLREWLRPLQGEGKVLPKREIWREVTGLAKQLGFGWEPNVLRHSAISYRVATTQNVNQVALESGNSPTIIFKHYRELVTPAQAQQWWAIRPKKRGKIGKAVSPTRNR